MRGALSPPNPTPSRPVGGEVVLVSAPKPVCVPGSPGIPARTMLGRAKFGMVEDVEELPFQAQLNVLTEWNRLGKIKVTPKELRAAQRVAAQSSELAIRGTVAARAGARAGVDGRNKGVRIEPLEGAGLRHPRDGFLFIQRHTRNHTRELRSATLHDAIPAVGIRSALDRKGNSAMPERRTRHLPVIQSVTEAMASHLDRQFINVLAGEVVADVVIAGTVVAGQLTRQRGKNPP